MPSESSACSVSYFALSAHIVLIQTLKQQIQLLISLQEFFEFLFFHRTFLSNRLLRMSHNRPYKIIFILAGELRKPADFAQNDLFQKINPDIMAGFTRSSGIIIVGAAEISNFRISLIEVKIQIASAVRANQQARKHVSLSILAGTFANLAALFLHLFPRGPVNDGLMHIFKNSHVFRIILLTLLVFIGLAVGFEVYQIAAILTGRQDFGNG